MWINQWERNWRWDIKKNGLNWIKDESKYSDSGCWGNELVFEVKISDIFRAPTFICISEIFLTKFMKRKMKEFNIFNKYENEEMKNKLKKMKSPPIKTVDNM